MTSSTEENMDVHHFPEPSTPELVEFENNYSFHASQRTPIVIDNGSSNFRFGWASSSDPYVSPNLYAKYRDKRSNRAVLLFGDAVDADTQGKGTAKSPWEGDHLNNHEALESALDYTFLRLGIDGETVDHPVIMSERLCSISHSRSLTSEMLFELYSIPSVTYAVDALTSFSHNVQGADRDGLVISFNTASTSIIPVLNGRGIFGKTKRLPWGGQQASEYLLKLVQLKYSGFPTRVTSAQSTWMYQTFSEFSLDYIESLRMLDDPVEMSRASKVVQFPFPAPVEKIKTEEEMAALAEKRREAGRRLQEQAAKKRIEKIMEKEKDLEAATNLRDWKEKENKAEFMARLRQTGFDSEQDWEDNIKRLEIDLKKARKKDLGDEEPAEEPTFPLVDVADSELDEESLKEKRRQRLMKGLHEARLRARQEKEKERAAAAEEERLETIEREQNPEGWKGKWRKEHETIVNKMKNRERRKVDLQDRKSAASQSRMKSIANLTGEQPPLKKRRRKGGDDDDFGANDEDWMIYRQINGGNGSSEEEDLSQLATIESRLLAHDANFSSSDTYAAISTQKSALIRAFCPAHDTAAKEDIEIAHRMHLNVERWKVPEAWFCPSMAGMDCAGLGEIIAHVLSSFTEAERLRMVKNVFLTGGPAQIPNLTPRLLSTIRPILPPNTEISIRLASDPQLDAYQGMAAFARTPEFGQPEFGALSKADYDEHGSDRIRKWWGGNVNYAIY